MSRIEIPVTMATKMLAKAIHAIQKEAEAATLEALSAKDGIVALSGPDREMLCVSSFGDKHVIDDDRGYEVRLYRHRTCPQEWKSCPHLHHPAYWHVYEARVDGSGVRWDRESQVCVTDDFGTLVPVKGGAQ